MITLSKYKGGQFAQEKFKPYFTVFIDEEVYQANPILMQFCIFGDVFLVDESAFKIKFQKGYTERIYPQIYEAQISELIPIVSGSDLPLEKGQNIVMDFCRQYYFMANNADFDYKQNVKAVIDDVKRILQWLEQAGRMNFELTFLELTFAYCMHMNIYLGHKRTYYFGLFNYWIGRPGCIFVPGPFEFTLEEVIKQKEVNEQYQTDVAEYIRKNNGPDTYNVFTDAIQLVIIQGTMNILNQMTYYVSHREIQDMFDLEDFTWLENTLVPENFEPPSSDEPRFYLKETRYLDIVAARSDGKFEQLQQIALEKEMKMKAQKLNEVIQQRKREAEQFEARMEKANKQKQQDIAEREEARKQVEEYKKSNIVAIEEEPIAEAESIQEQYYQGIQPIGIPKQTEAQEKEIEKIFGDISQIREEKQKPKPQVNIKRPAIKGSQNILRVPPQQAKTTAEARQVANLYRKKQKMSQQQPSQQKGKPTIKVKPTVQKRQMDIEEAQQQLGPVLKDISSYQDIANASFMGKQAAENPAVKAMFDRLGSIRSAFHEVKHQTLQQQIDEADKQIKQEISQQENDLLLQLQNLFINSEMNTDHITNVNDNLDSYLAYLVAQVQLLNLQPWKKMVDQGVFIEKIQLDAQAAKQMQLDIINKIQDTKDQKMAKINMEVMEDRIAQFTDFVRENKLQQYINSNSYIIKQQKIMEACQLKKKFLKDSMEISAFYLSTGYTEASKEAFLKVLPLDTLSFRFKIEAVYYVGAQSAAKQMQYDNIFNAGTFSIYQYGTKNINTDAMLSTEILQVYYYADNMSLYKCFLIWTKTSSDQLISFSKPDQPVTAVLIVAQALKSINKVNFEQAVKNKVNNYKTSLNSFRPLISKIEHVVMSKYKKEDLSDVRILPITLPALMRGEIKDKVTTQVPITDFGLCLMASRQINVLKQSESIQFKENIQKNSVANANYTMFRKKLVRQQVYKLRNQKRKAIQMSSDIFKIIDQTI